MPLVLVLALVVAACSSGSTDSSTSTTAVAVTSPSRMLGEWVPADLRPGGLLIGDTLTTAGNRFVIFEEIDGTQVAVWTSEDGRSWSAGDDSAFPPGAHVKWARGNQHGAEQRREALEPGAEVHEEDQVRRKKQREPAGVPHGSRRRP